ncbi:hypothetical protein [Natronolimnobius baerhuensis]|uniref:hypothetical protein n=1 Tax=Natronolimnobius baerhuensis TaxID=253108 RepID=UPI0015957798|nr:hypothetical protein [Natronolimnobius baerhuensis]
MLGAAIQRFAMVLALVGGLGELALGTGALLLVLALPVGIVGVALELSEFHYFRTEGRR